MNDMIALTLPGYNVDWANLPICGTQGLVVSPNICIPVVVDAPLNTPAVPIPGAGLLFASALAALILVFNRKHR
jgi:hypothetical protein